MWRGIVFNAIYQCFILTVILFEGDEIFGVKHFSELPEGEYIPFTQ